jgi:hypothetical protein
MFVTELFDKFEGTKADMTGYQNADEDHTVLKLSDLRKTKLTLAQLNRLRIMSDTRKLEHQKDLIQVQKQYAAPASEEPAM